MNMPRIREKQLHQALHLAGEDNERLRARVLALESEAAAMRAVLEGILPGCTEGSAPETEAEIRAALASGAGKQLLDRVKETERKMWGARTQLLVVACTYQCSCGRRALHEGIGFGGLACDDHRDASKAWGELPWAAEVRLMEAELDESRAGGAPE